ncbi:MAG: ATP-binding protein, partial [Thermoanaerobaculia bacterium]
LEERLPVDFGCVCRYEAPADHLTVAHLGVGSAGLAIAPGLGEQERIPLDHGLSRCIEGHLLYEPDVHDAASAFLQRLAGGGLRSLVAAPLLTESKVFGVLVAARRREDAFSSGDCEFLRQVSEHVALAAHQAQLHGALQQAYDDLRQTQQVVMQQERLRALGQMASGIAHDINNAISPVALYTDSLLDREPGLSERARDYLVTIRRAIDDVAGTVARMREFYRPREAQTELAPVALNRLIEQVVELTRARWSDEAQRGGAVIDVASELAADLPAVMGVEGDIRDALTNLIFNAVDAMPDGGRLRVCTSVLAPQEQDGAAPRRVRVEVLDTGVGMDEATRRRCLEPFFTTKGERGTGLGLAMVYGMAQRHGAELEIDSMPGLGTIVRLVFAAAAPESAAAVRSLSPTEPGKPLRILVVDDDPWVLKSLRDTLAADGHSVTAAEGGQAGIDEFLAAQRRGELFAVVFTDLGMPFVDGRKVAAAVRAASSTTPVILLTGWGQGLNGDVPPHVSQVLSKPPRLPELRSALANLTGD